MRDEVWSMMMCIASNTGTPEFMRKAKRRAKRLYSRIEMPPMMNGFFSPSRSCGLLGLGDVVFSFLESAGSLNARSESPAFFAFSFKEARAFLMVESILFMYHAKHFSHSRESFLYFLEPIFKHRGHTISNSNVANIFC